MTHASKILTLLIMGALFVLIITHPAGFAADSMAAGSVVNQTLLTESGSGVTSGTSGSFSLPGGGNVSVA
jgi:hypothetical protein